MIAYAYGSVECPRFAARVFGDMTGFGQVFYVPRVRDGRLPVSFPHFHPQVCANFRQVIRLESRWEFGSNYQIYLSQTPECSTIP